MAFPDKGDDVRDNFYKFPSRWAPGLRGQTSVGPTNQLNGFRHDENDLVLQCERCCLFQTIFFFVTLFPQRAACLHCCEGVKTEGRDPQLLSDSGHSRPLGCWWMFFFFSRATPRPPVCRIMFLGSGACWLDYEHLFECFSSRHFLNLVVQTVFFWPWWSRRSVL